MTSRLTKVSPGVYFPANKPSKEEFYAGNEALKSWKNATREQRSRLAEDIVVGETLKGLSRAEIVAHLGAFFDENPDYCSYNIYDGEGSGKTLNIVFDEQNRVTCSYIEFDG